MHACGAAAANAPSGAAYAAPACLGGFKNLAHGIRNLRANACRKTATKQGRGWAGRRGRGQGRHTAELALVAARQWQRAVAAPCSAADVLSCVIQRRDPATGRPRAWQRCFAPALRRRRRPAAAVVTLGAGRRMRVPGCTPSSPSPGKSVAVTGAWVDSARTATPLLLLLGPPACRPRSTEDAIALRIPITLPAVNPR